MNKMKMRKNRNREKRKSNMKKRNKKQKRRKNLLMKNIYVSLTLRFINHCIEEQIDEHVVPAIAWLKKKEGDETYLVQIHGLPQTISKDQVVRYLRKKL